MTESSARDEGKTGINHPEGINKYTFSVQLLIWASVFTGCFFVAQMVSGAMIISYYKTMDIRQIAAQPENLNVLRYAQMLASLGGFLLPALVFSRLKKRALLKYSNADKGFSPLFIVLVPLMLYAFYAIIDVSFFVNKVMPWNDWMKDYQGEYKAIVDGLLKDNSIFVFVLNFLTVAALPAICEEWIFRGTLQQLFSEMFNVHLAVFFAAVFFSLIHFEFSGFLPRIILGMFLGYLFYYSGSLWVSIFAHLVNNGVQVILMYLNNRGIYKTDVDNPVMPTGAEFMLYTTGFVICWVLFYHFAQKRKKSNFA